MRAITKGREPASLTRYRQTEHCDYENYTDKEALRHALVTEQRGICCYCMGRIHNGPLTMKIEHWQSQRRYPTEQLSYRNLLGACLGGGGQPPHLQHCDTRKRDRDLRWNPANPLHRIETRLRYESDGSIRSEDPIFDSQLVDVLNLNLEFLKNNRKALREAIVEWWTLERAKLHGPVPRARFERERERLTQTGELMPFCQAAIWWLDQRLARMPV
jgi:uncharacterized protein (TIGR02646 family)